MYSKRYNERVARAGTPEPTEGSFYKSGRILSNVPLARLVTTAVPEETQEQTRAVQALALFLEKRNGAKSSNLLGNGARELRSNSMDLDSGSEQDEPDERRTRVSEPVSDIGVRKRGRNSPERNGMATSDGEEESDVSDGETLSLDSDYDSDDEGIKCTTEEWGDYCPCCDKPIVVRRLGRCGEVDV